MYTRTHRLHGLQRFCASVCVCRCGLAFVYAVEYGGAVNALSAANHVAAAATFKKSNQNTFSHSLYMLHVLKKHTQKKIENAIRILVYVGNLFGLSLMKVRVCVARNFFSKLFRIPFMASKFSANHPRCKWPVNFDADDELSRLHLSRAPVNILDLSIKWWFECFWKWNLASMCLWKEEKKLFFSLDSIGHFRLNLFEFRSNWRWNATALTYIPFEFINCLMFMPITTNLR